MIRTTLVAIALVAGLSLSVASSHACDPKQDPTCGNRSADTVAAPAPCDPKQDPSCDRSAETVAAPAPCDPKDDPTCY
ncbi:hypothetical protein OAG71_03010 [bacterium]|nr:hypothetical protein [bacterium]